MNKYFLTTSLSPGSCSTQDLCGLQSLVLHIILLLSSLHPVTWPALPLPSHCSGLTHPSLPFLIQPRSQRKLSEPLIQSPLFPGESPAGQRSPRDTVHASQHGTQGPALETSWQTCCPLGASGGLSTACTPFRAAHSHRFPLHITIAPASPHHVAQQTPACIISTLPHGTSHGLGGTSASLWLHISSREQGLLCLAPCPVPQCLQRCLVGQGAHSSPKDRKTATTAFSLRVLGCPPSAAIVQLIITSTVTTTLLSRQVLKSKEPCPTCPWTPSIWHVVSAWYCLPHHFHGAHVHNSILYELVILFISLLIIIVQV